MSRNILDTIASKLSARHGLYLACHVILVLVGLVIMLSDPEGLDRKDLYAPVGGSLVAMGVGGAVLFLMVWIDQANSRRLRDIEDFGVSRIFAGRSVRIRKEYDERLEGASEAIDIMGFGLSHLREDYGEAFDRWAERAVVRLLVLDPEFPEKRSRLADLRDVEEGNSAGDIATDVEKLVKTCRHLLVERPERFQVRLYRCLPSINFFRIDEEIFWGPYLIGDVSRNMPTFLMSKHGKLSRKLMEHFERIWGNEKFSREVPRDWLE